jgi:ArsR family transcriptional regulator, nickel/cobalt-responsive transcriptional repressor
LRGRHGVVEHFRRFELTSAPSRDTCETPEYVNNNSDILQGMSHGYSPDLDRLLRDAAYARAAAEAIQALASPTRLRILARLHVAPASVGELAVATGMEDSAVSHQLRLMRNCGLVVGERRGRRVIYALHDPHVAEVLEQVVAHVDHVHHGLAERIRPLSPIHEENS